MAYTIKILELFIRHIEGYRKKENVVAWVTFLIFVYNNFRNSQVL